MMATWQEINQMWAAVNELYGGLSASTAMPGRWMDVVGKGRNSHQRSQSLSPLHVTRGSPRCVSMSRSVMRRTILPEITSGGTKKANQERPTWREGYT